MENKQRIDIMVDSIVKNCKPYNHVQKEEVTKFDNGRAIIWQKKQQI